MITRAHVISSPDDNDIILGKKAANTYKTHPGNQQYRAIVDGAKQQYNSYPKYSDIRTNFPSCIMNAICGEGYRFVVLNDEDKFVIPSDDYIESAIHNRLQREGSGNSNQTNNNPISITTSSNSKRKRTNGSAKKKKKKKKKNNNSKKKMIIEKEIQILPTLKSHIIYGWFDDNIKKKDQSAVVNSLVKKIGAPTKLPEDIGPGMNVTADSARGQTLVNTERPKYLIGGQYGDVIGALSHNPDTHGIRTYGTGIGNVSHGIKASMNSFLPMPSSFKPIKKALDKECRTYAKNNPKSNINTKCELNTAVLPVYLPPRQVKDPPKQAQGQCFRPHCDQVHDSEGNFDGDKNCQLENTIVCSLAFGPTRTMKFDLVRYPTKAERKRGIDKPINMGYTNELEFPNGAMMMLIPEDEVPKVREVCKEYKTFWRHSVDAQKEMTTGIVFRVSCHIKEVYTSTGMLALSPEELAEDRRKSKKNYEVRDEYMNSPRKEMMDKVIMKAWEKLKEKYLAKYV